MTAEGPEEAGAGTSAKQGWRQDPRYEEVETWVTSMWDRIRESPDRPRGWKGSRDQAIMWYLNHYLDFERQREDLKRDGSKEVDSEIRMMKTAEADPYAEEVWTAVKGELALATSQPVYETWIAGTVAHSFDDELLIVVVPTPFAVEWLERRMYQTIVSHIRRVAGFSAGVKFVVADEGGG